MLDTEDRSPAPAPAPAVDVLAWSLDQAAQSLGISLRSLRILIDRGELLTFTIGRRRLIRPAELLRLVDAKAREARQ